MRAWASILTVLMIGAWVAGWWLVVPHKESAVTEPVVVVAPQPPAVLDVSLPAGVLKHEEVDPLVFPTWILAWATIALAVFTGLLFYFTYGLWSRTKEMVEQAKSEAGNNQKVAEATLRAAEGSIRSAEAAEGAVKIAQRMGELQTKAYLVATEGHLVVENEYPFVAITFANSGQSPAYYAAFQTFFSIREVIGRQQFAVNLELPQINGIAPLATIGAGHSYETPRFRISSPIWFYPAAGMSRSYADSRDAFQAMDPNRRYEFRVIVAAVWENVFKDFDVEYFQGTVPIIENRKIFQGLRSKNIVMFSVNPDFGRMDAFLDARLKAAQLK